MKLYTDGPAHGVSFRLDNSPRIKWKHIDGPMLCFSDGQLHWLTWRERLLCWLGREDAEGLQRKLRPRLTRVLEWGRSVAEKSPR